MGQLFSALWDRMTWSPVDPYNPGEVEINIPLEIRDVPTLQNMKRFAPRDPADELSLDETIASGLQAPKPEKSMPAKTKPGLWKGYKSNVNCLNCCLTCLMIICLFFLLAALLNIPKPDITEVTLSCIFLAFVYVFYIVECFYCKTFKLLTAGKGAKETAKQIEKLKQEAPTIKWKLEAYHYYYYTANRGRRRKEKRVTLTARREIKYGEWKDISPDFEDVISSPNLTRVTFINDFMFADQQSKETYERQKKEFRLDNWRDKYQGFDVLVNLKGQKECMLVEGKGCSLPWWMDVKAYVLFSLLGFSFMYRIIFQSVTYNITYYYVKEIKM